MTMESIKADEVRPAPPVEARYGICIQNSRLGGTFGTKDALKVEELFFEQLCATMGAEESLCEASKKLQQEEKRQAVEAHKVALETSRAKLETAETQLRKQEQKRFELLSNLSKKHAADVQANEMKMTLQMEQIKSLEAERDNIHIGRHKDSNQIRALENACKKLEDEKTGLVQELRTTRQSNTRLEAKGKQMAALEKDLAVVKGELRKTKIDYSATVKDLRTVADQLARMHAKVFNSQTSTEAYKSKVAGLQRELEAKDAQYSSLETELAAKTERVNHLEADLASKTASSDGSQEELATLRARLKAAVDERGELLEKLDTCSAEVAELYHQLNNASALEADLRQQVEQATRMVTERDARVANFECMLTEVHTKVEEGEAQVADLRAKLTEANTKATRLQEQLAAAQTHRTASEDDTKLQVKKLQSSLHKVEDEKKELAKQLTDAKAKLADDGAKRALTGDRDRALSKAEQTRKELAGLTREYEASQKARAAATAKLAEMEEKIRGLEAQGKLAAEKTEKLEAALASTKQQAVDTAVKLAAAEATNRQQQEELERHQAERASEKAELEGKLAEEQAKTKALENQLREMQAAATAPAAPSPAATFDADVAAVLPPREAFGQASTLEDWVEHVYVNGVPPAVRQFMNVFKSDLESMINNMHKEISGDYPSNIKGFNPDMAPFTLKRRCKMLQDAQKIGAIAVYRAIKSFKKKVAQVVRDLCSTKDLKMILGLAEDVQRAIAASVVESIKVLEASRPSDIHGPPVGEGVAYYRALADGMSFVEARRLVTSVEDYQIVAPAITPTVAAMPETATTSPLRYNAAAFDFAPRSSSRDQLVSQLSSHNDGQAKMQRALAEAKATFPMCPPRNLQELHHAMHNRRSPDVPHRSFHRHDDINNNFSAGNGPVQFAHFDNTNTPAFDSSGSFDSRANHNFPMGPAPMGHDFASPSFFHGPFRSEMNSPTGFMPFPPNMGPMMPPGMPWPSPQLPSAPGPSDIPPGVPTMPGLSAYMAPPSDGGASLFPLQDRRNGCMF